MDNARLGIGRRDGKWKRWSKGKYNPKQHKLKIEVSNTKVVIAGKKDQESNARQKLYDIIYNILSDCPLFQNAGRDDAIANAIAYGGNIDDEFVPSIRYQVVSDSVKEPFFVNIKTMDVRYRNLPRGWKWWARIRDNVNNAVMGARAE